MDLFGTYPDILDVTLRDGSYLIDFQFTAQDTAVIASALESVGFSWIEVGHGVGLNASASGKGAAAATDEQYLESASEALASARWGMFFIPGIGRVDDLRLAARYKMSFVRIGTNVTEYEQAEPFVKRAKDLGMLVSYNGMKSYAVSPQQWGRCAAQVHQWGADIVCLVDSAGSMYPEDVSSYLKSAQLECSAPLGFHGHNNLSLAMANTLRAIDEGAVLVDTSLQGMGRSAGNAITEVLVAILKKRGLLPGIDMKSVMDIGAGLIRPLLGRPGIDPMAVTGGFASFHSSFTPKVVRYAEKHSIDVRDLIVRLCEEDLISAPDDLLERLAGELARAKRPHVLSIPAFRIGEQKSSEGWEALDVLLKELHAKAVKAGMYSALNAVIAESPLEHIMVSGNVQHTLAHVVGSVKYTTNGQLETILQRVDGKVDVLLLDVDRKPSGPSKPASVAADTLKKTALLTYLDSRVWIAAVEDQVVRLLSENLDDVSIVIGGDHSKSRLLAMNLAERCAHVTVLSTGRATPTSLGALSPSGEESIRYVEAGTREAGDRIAEARLLVVWPGGAPWLGRADAGRLAPTAYVLEADAAAIPPETRTQLQDCKALLVKLNMWPTLAGALEAAHESQRVFRECMGRATMAGVPVVAGGAMGRKGDVIVDNVRNPSRVIGIADGQGDIIFRFTPEEATSVRSVTEEINSRMVMPHLTVI
jgi:4-hydroxy-2-oxovalerate aldolase